MGWGIDFWWGVSLLGGFLGGGDEQTFNWLGGGGGDTPKPPVGKTQVFQATCTSAVPVLYKSSGIILQEFVWK